MPWLAESWGIETENREEAGEEKPVSVLTFTLRPGLRWQDGRPLTAEDVAFSLLYVRDRKIPRFFDSVKDIGDIQTDGNRIRVRMANTSYWHLHNIGGMIVLPKHILEKVPDWRTWQPASRAHEAADGEPMTELVGTGPFIFKESRTGEYIHMTRNERYMWYRP
jgi:peptide/nickel transport system substrate-binding protein